MWLKFMFKTGIFDQKMSDNDKKMCFFTQNSYIGAANPNFVVYSVISNCLIFHMTPKW